MKLKSEQITSLSDKGYIDDFGEVEKILTKLSAMPVSDFHNESSNVILNCLSDFMEDNSMNLKRINDVTYAEALGMIDGVVTSGTYDCNGTEWCKNKRYALLGHFETMLLLSRDDTAMLRLFMSITVKSYFNFFVDKSRFNNNFYDTFRSNIEKEFQFELKDSTTMKDLFFKINSLMCHNWMPEIPIGEFRKSVLNSYEILHVIFIELYRGVFYKSFDLQNLKEKYPKEEF